jgi:hypothetical protein
MVAPVDPRAEKVRRRKTKKRKPYMTRDTLGAVKLIIRGTVLAPQQNPDDAECPDCLSLNQKVA